MKLCLYLTLVRAAEAPIRSNSGHNGGSKKRDLASSDPCMRGLHAVLFPQQYCLAFRVVYCLPPWPMALDLFKLWRLVPKGAGQIGRSEYRIDQSHILQRSRVYYFGDTLSHRVMHELGFGDTLSHREVHVTPRLVYCASKCTNQQVLSYLGNTSS